MKGCPLGPGGEDITWPDQVASRGRRTSSTQSIKAQTSNHTTQARKSVRCVLLVMGPNARIPRAQRQKAAGPGRTVQGRAVRGR